MQGAGYYDHEFDEQFLEGVRIVDCGDVDMIHMDPHRCLQNAYEASREITSKDALLVVMGGDHAVPIPVVRALKEKGPFHVVQFDAHLDFVDERFGVREAHGNPMRRISEMGHVTGITQIGIRGPGSSGRQDFDDARAYGSTIIGTREFRHLGAENVVSRLPTRSNFYITIDCDVLDPALAPGTGSPSPGGLDYYELTDTLRGIAARGDVVGFDYCEVAPMYDPSGITCQVAARVILDFLGAIFSEKKRREQANSSYL
jgi:agmatinase